MAENYKVLYRKYRPKTFDDVIGQETTISLLKDCIAKDKISHAYIFSGPRGTGKTSSAKIFAKAINCLNNVDGNPCGECENCVNFHNSSDIYEIDAASNNGVDQVREIIDNIKLAPISLKYKVYIIDEVHMLSDSAFNALLLTLEEPPSHVVFILATTNIEEVLITVLSRCQRLDYRKISDEKIFECLSKISREENIQVEDNALREIAVVSEGGMRDALSILDQLSKLGKMITEDDVNKSIGVVSNRNIELLLDSVDNNDIDGVEEFIEKVRTLSSDYKLICKKIIEIVKKRAVKIKEDSSSFRLTYSEYKNMCFEIASTVYKANVNLDSYSLLELILLDYCKTSVEDENYVQNKEITQEKIQKVVGKVEENVEENDISTPQISIDTSIIDIRINNCFVKAKKEYLQENKLIWQKFINDDSNKKNRGILLDSELVLSSDEIMVVKYDLEDKVEIFNEIVNELNEVFNSLYNKNFKFVAVSTLRWQNEMEKFKQSLLKKQPYKFQKEPDDDIQEELFDEVFSKDIIEFK